MTNYLSTYFSSGFSSVKEIVKVNSELLVQIFVLLTVPFTTIRAFQVVYEKINVPNSSAILTNAIPVEISTTFESYNNYRQAREYYVPTLPELKNEVDLSNRESTQALPILTFQGPDKVFIPILIYHRIDFSTVESQYYVSPIEFEAQMKLLHDWGYTTITTELLVKAINEGAKLPQRPILITFDDGHLNNYTIAYPIMKKYGFSGVLYIVGEYIGVSNYMNADQIKEMSLDGWEVGSHSMNHLDLTSLDRQQQQYEIVESRKLLETELGIPIQTFAYPFGIYDQTVINLTYSAGYIAAMGTGYTYNQGTLNLFALQRRGVNGTRDIITFASVLPWQGDLAYLPSDTTVSSQTQDTANAASP